MIPQPLSDEEYANLVAQPTEVGNDRERMKALLAQRALRKKEALQLFEPMPNQVPFFASRAPIRLIRGGNRAGKALRDDMPVLTPWGWVAIGSLLEGDTVIGGDGKPCRVVGVYPQGEKETFEVTFDDGASVVCCNEHLWKCKLKKRERFGKNRDSEVWSVRSLAEIRQHGGDCPISGKKAVIPVQAVEFAERPVPVDAYLLGVLIGDGSLAHCGLEFTTADPDLASSLATAAVGCTVTKRASAKYTYSIRSNKKTCHDSYNPIVKELRQLGLWGSKSEAKFVPDLYLFNSRQVRLGVLQGLMDTDGSVSKNSHCEFSTTSRQLAEDVVFLVRSLGGKARVVWRTTSYTHKGTVRQGRPSARIFIKMPFDCPFRLQRKASRWWASTKNTRHRLIERITPLGRAKCTCICVDSPDHTFITKDFIVTHNSRCMFTELARAATGQDPYKKYPTDRPLLIYLLTYQQETIGRVAYQMLFGRRYDKFRRIRDLHTGEWRAYRPWDPNDKAREQESEPAGPLIPERMIPDGAIAYEDKRKKQFTSVTLKIPGPMNGTEIRAYSSKSEPAMGDPVDLVAIDEDLYNEDWLPEMEARLSDNNGKLIWSAWPKTSNNAMIKLSERAERARGTPNPDVEEFLFRFSDNMFIDAEAKAVRIRGWTPDERRSRDYGEYLTSNVLMYPDFNMYVHGVPRLDPSNPTPDKLEAFLEANAA